MEIVIINPREDQYGNCKYKSFGYKEVGKNLMFPGISI